MVKSPKTLGRFLLSLLLRRDADEAERLDAQGCFSKTSTVQKKQLWFVVYLWSVVPDFLFPARRCLGLRSNTCRSDSPFLPWRFMSFWEFFIIFLAFFTIWQEKIQNTDFKFLFLTFLHQKELLWGSLHHLVHFIFTNNNNNNNTHNNNNMGPLNVHLSAFAQVDLSYNICYYFSRNPDLAVRILSFFPTQDVHHLPRQQDVLLPHWSKPPLTPLALSWEEDRPGHRRGSPRHQPAGCQPGAPADAARLPAADRSQQLQGACTASLLHMDHTLIGLHYVLLSY